MQRAGLLKTGIPEESLESDQTLRRFLTEGSISGSIITIESLSDEQFWSLWEIVNGWYDMNTLEFAAVEARRTKDWKG